MEFAKRLFDGGDRRGAFLDGLAGPPIQTFHLIGKHDAVLAVRVIDDHFERILFPLSGHRAAEHQAASPVVGRR